MAAQSTFQQPLAVRGAPDLVEATSQRGKVDDDDRAGRFVGVGIDQGATELAAISAWHAMLTTGYRPSLGSTCIISGKSLWPPPCGPKSPPNLTIQESSYEPGVPVGPTE